MRGEEPTVVEVKEILMVPQNLYIVVVKTISSESMRLNPGWDIGVPVKQAVSEWHRGPTFEVGLEAHLSLSAANSAIWKSGPNVPMATYEVIEYVRWGSR